MRNFIFISLTILCLQSFAHATERTIHQPSFHVWNSTTLEINKIVLSDTATIMFIDAYYRPDWWIQIDAESYLLSGSQKYPILGSKGIALNEKIFMPSSGTISFELIFPPLPTEVTEIDFIEGDGERAFQIRGIRLDGTGPEPISIQTGPVKENTELETPVLQKGNAILKGELKGFRPGLEFDQRIWLFNAFTGGSEDYELKVDENGLFHLEVPLAYINPLYVYSAFFNGAIYLKPGEETYLIMNLPEICRSQSRIHQSTPSLGEKYYFRGAMASLNQEIANVTRPRLLPHPTNEEEYKQMLREIASRNAEEIKSFWLDQYREIRENLESNRELSETYRTILLKELQIETAQKLFSSRAMFDYAYRITNELEREALIPESVKPVFTDEYYDFIPEFIPNSSMGLYYGRPFTEMAQSIPYYFRMPYDTDPEKENLPSFAQYMKTDKGFLFDLIRAQQLGEKMAEHTPLNEEELKLAETISPAVFKILNDVNNRLIAQIEENKKKTGYTIHPVDISDIPIEEVFPQIIEPYKGKVVFVDFWATWCGPCLQAMKSSEPVKEEFIGKDVIFLYLSAESSPENTWKQMIPDIKGDHYRATKDQFNHWADKYGISAIPSYMVIAKDGTPAHFQVGFMGADKMKEILFAELDK